MFKKQIMALASCVLALSMVVNTWAYYTSTNSIDNALQTASYGNQLVEEFTPDTDWQPGENVKKIVGVENTGDSDLFVRIKLEEKWTLAGGATLSMPSSNSQFLTATAASATQGNPTDGLTTNDHSVVYKELVAGGWTLNPTDGYWYLNTKLLAGTSSAVFLNSITLAGNTDMGSYTTTNYYTTAPLASKPANNVIGSNPASQWVVYTGDVPAGASFTRAASIINPSAPGYADAKYTLTITSETIQATQEAFTATAGWSTGTPAGVKSAWGVL